MKYTGNETELAASSPSEFRRLLDKVLSIHSDVENPCNCVNNTTNLKYVHLS